ncbi:MAG: caspase family protein [Acidobacteria bacterium]|nr:caspase family protein [Acidobacteriota bacterium]
MLRIVMLLLFPVLLFGQSPQAGNSTRRVSVPRGYALIIGISNYQNLQASAQLQFPESDAEALYRVLISHEGGAFPPENVHILKGKEATLSNIRRELEEWLPSVAQPADRVAVYFAGHGLVKDGKGYFAPWDVDPANPDTTGYPMPVLGDVIANRVKARWKVLFTDACHSGNVTAETTNESIDAELRKLPSNFLTLTATMQRENSYEDPNLSTGFGIFTYFLTQAFAGNADNDPCDGKITADELIEYVRVNVRRYTRDRSVFQTPQARGDYEPEMLLGVSTSCLQNLTSRGASNASSMLGTAIVEINMADVDVFMDGKPNSVGKVSPGRPLILPGLTSGLHDFEAVKQGYEPDRKQIMIVPGQEVTVTLRIRYPKKIKQSAIDLMKAGEKLLLSQRSTVNPVDLLFAPDQNNKSLQKARDLFEQALREEPNYSTAAFYLGQVNQILLDEKAALAAYKKAIQIDPGYVDARRQYAAVLIETGDTDEAIRQLTESIRLDPNSDEAYSLMSRAYWDKGIWSRSIETADEALKSNPSNAQAHLWRADSLRQLAAVEKDPARLKPMYESARDSYDRFLKLTNIKTSAPCAIGFLFGVCRRNHADRQSSFELLRSGGFLGMCISEQKIGNPLKAKGYCERAIENDDTYPIAHFILGNVYRDLFNNTGACEYLAAARNSYSEVIRLNPHIIESNNAKHYLEQIQKITSMVPDKRCGQGG